VLKNLDSLRSRTNKKQNRMQHGDEVEVAVVVVLVVVDLTVVVIAAAVVVVVVEDDGDDDGDCWGGGAAVNGRSGQACTPDWEKAY
jgi:hypothetical protein